MLFGWGRSPRCAGWDTSLSHSSNRPIVELTHCYQLSLWHIVKGRLWKREARGRRVEGEKRKERQREREEEREALQEKHRFYLWHYQHIAVIIEWPCALTQTHTCTVKARTLCNQVHVLEKGCSLSHTSLTTLVCVIAWWICMLLCYLIFYMKLRLFAHFPQCLCIQVCTLQTI